MKGSTILGVMLGVVIGAVGVTMYKPAQTAVRNSTNAIKDEAETLIEKVKNKNCCNCDCE